MYSAQNELSVSNHKVFAEQKPYLDEINWDFSDNLFSKNQGGVTFDSRKFFPYPGTYVPEIPYTLIEALTKEFDTILDPFAGSGTTIFQSIILRRFPLGYDTCSISSFFINNLINLLSPRINLETLGNEFLKSISYSNVSNNTFSPNFEKLNPWFGPKTYQEIKCLKNRIEIESNHLVSSLISISILTSLNSITSQGRGWGCIADNMLPKKEQLKEFDVKKIVGKKGISLINYIKNFQHIIQSRQFEIFFDQINTQGIERVKNNDCRYDLEHPSKTIDTIITSPPYPNMTDYITSQRLGYYFLGLDPDSDKKKETGARHKRKRKSSVSDYKNEMIKFNCWFEKNLKPGGFICMVLPEFESKQKVTARKIAIDEIIENLESFPSIELLKIYERLLPTIRRSHNSKWASLKKEKIYIFQKI
jgi:DNA modification methylase